MWPLLDPLSPQEREELLALARPREFSRDEVMYHEGDPADSLHLVAAGHLAVRTSLPAGAIATLTVLAKGDYFGELALLRTDRRGTATVVALEHSRTLSIAASAFDRLRSRNPRVERASQPCLPTGWKC